MRKLVFTMLCLAVPSIAGAYEMRLAWSNCLGAGGATTATFACNTNSNMQAHTLVASFYPPEGIVSYVGNEVTLDVSFLDAVTPDWWAMKGTGQCRNGAAISDASFAGGPFGCVDPWASQAVGGIANYNIAFTAPNRVRIQLAFAVPASSAQPLDANQEYYACKLTLLNTKTVGTGSCTGCSSPAAFMVSDVVLNQIPSDGSAHLGGVGTQNMFAGWQCPVSFGFCDGCGTTWQPSCATPTRSATWGAIKAIYH